MAECHHLHHRIRIRTPRPRGVAIVLQPNRRLFRQGGLCWGIYILRRFPIRRLQRRPQRRLPQQRRRAHGCRVVVPRRRRDGCRSSKCSRADSLLDMGHHGRLDCLSPRGVVKQYPRVARFTNYRSDRILLDIIGYWRKAYICTGIIYGIGIPYTAHTDFL